MMCAMSPGERVLGREQSALKIQPLGDKENLQALDAFQMICQTCYGPQSNLKMVHNNRGGHVTLSSSSQRLLPVISISKPILRLVTSAMQEHLKLYSDGALFAGLLSIKLVKSSLQLNINRKLTIELNELILELCKEYLHSEQCRCKVKIDMSSTGTLLTLAANIISSKPGCLCSSRDVDFLARLLLESFLKTCNVGNGHTNFSHKHYLCVEGLAPRKSHIVDGILFETPQIPVYQKIDLSVKQVPVGEHKGCVKTAIFNVSMSGDSEEFIDAVYEVEDELGINNVIVEKLKQCAVHMISCGVGLVACQRVIHPAVKKLLRSSGVLVLDRLSIRYIKSMHDLAGGRLLSSFHYEPEEKTFGHLREINHQVTEGKSYLKLVGMECSVHTLVVCHQSEEALAELKSVCEVVDHVLRMTISTPYGLCGAGCWQAHLAHHVKQQVSFYCEDWRKTLGCSKRQVYTVADNFTSCLMFTAGQLHKHVDHKTDLSAHHLWTVPTGSDSFGQPQTDNLCECGAYKHVDDNEYEYLNEHRSVDKLSSNDKILCQAPKIIDAFLPLVSALKMAVGLANMILGIESFVQDKN